MDIDDIDYGEEFARKINERLDEADVIVAVIAAMGRDAPTSRPWRRLRAPRTRAFACHGQAHRACARRQCAAPGAGLPPDLAGLHALNCLRLEERSLKAH